ncbi:hypothetical protein [Hyphococcus luteus]|uniref:Uncharacterized protein n=1 Tax=Hyphococcus luteus TaxID=2058213 RepID=A0A2S7K0H6_9PROT|nr:hypothetical protein [Marinicaulis flavus]PQA86025.1 hypothetical protein CW354_16730 [Marinicaulis flavus]
MTKSKDRGRETFKIFIVANNIVFSVEPPVARLAIRDRVNAGFYYLLDGLRRPFARRKVLATSFSDHLRNQGVPVENIGTEAGRKFMRQTAPWWKVHPLKIRGVHEADLILAKCEAEARKGRVPIVKLNRWQPVIVTSVTRERVARLLGGQGAEVNQPGFTPA